MTGSAEASPQVYARLAGWMYVITILAGSSALLFAKGRLVANLVATVSYIAVTLLFYYVFKPAGRNLALFAAICSLIGCAWGLLSALGRAPVAINPLVFFGVYCLLIGYLIFKSTFLPRFLAALMAFGGLGWLTFLSEPLASYLSPYNMLPGILGETTLCLWLVVRGVDVRKWKEQAHSVHA